MFKKIVIGGAILAATSTLAFADGAYVGGDLGLNSNTYKLNDATSNTTNFNAHGLTIGALAGYGSTFNDVVYLGGEAFVNGGSINTSTKTIDSGNETAKLTSTYSFGLDFVPGIKVTPSTMIYGKLGVVGTRFKFNENPTAAGVASGSYVQGNSSQVVAGGRLGLGVQTDVNSNFAVRGEYVHTDYRSFKEPNIAGFSNTIKPKGNQVTVGLVYKFD